MSLVTSQQKCTAVKDVTLTANKEVIRAIRYSLHGVETRKSAHALDLLIKLAKLAQSQLYLFPKSENGTSARATVLFPVPSTCPGSCLLLE